jgi:hypothetical protein
VGRPALGIRENSLLIAHRDWGGMFG